MLEMKTGCQGCAAALAPQDDAYICSYECTYCVDCCTIHASVCPNCNGELVRRPRRDTPPGEQP